MSFLSPIFLFAIAAIGLPLIIHLINLKKPQKVAFSTLAFFKELQKTTIRKIRIKRYLLLFVRLLAILCFALVLARPFLPPGLAGGGDKSAALNVILLDNSISMNRVGEKGPLFEQAKEIIAGLEVSSKDTDRFIFQTTNGEEEFSSVIGHSQLLRKLETVQISKAGNYAIQRLQSLVKVLDNAPYKNKRLFIISDGQNSQFEDLSTIDTVPPSIITTFFKLGEVSVQNTLITSLQTSSDMIGLRLPVTLNVEVQNQSDIPISNQFITVQFEGNIIGQYSISLLANGKQNFDFEVIPTKSGSAIGKIIIEGDEFVSDNIRYFSIQVPEVREVLWVTSEKQEILDVSYTEMVLEASNQSDGQLRYQKIGIEDFEAISLESFNAIIFDGLRFMPEYAFQRLQNFVQNGGGIIVFPSEQANIGSYNNFFDLYNAGKFNGVLGNYASFKPVASGIQIQSDHPIFTKLFDVEENEMIRITNPNIFYFYSFQPSSSPGGFNIITLHTGNPLFREKRFGEGRVLISAIGNDAGWSNFGTQPLYAPFYYRTLLYVSSSAQGGLTEHILGKEFVWSGKISTDNVIIKKGEDDIVPKIRNTSMAIELSYNAINWEPGIASILSNEDEIKIAVNLNNTESEFIVLDDLSLSETPLKPQIVNINEISDQTLANEIIASGFGREVWQWFLWAGLFFLILESLIIIFYKAEHSIQ